MDYEKEIEDSIKEAIKNNSYIEADYDEDVLFPEVEDVQTFEEADLLTMNKGVVVDLKDGTRVYLTIQAYR